MKDYTSHPVKYQCKISFKGVSMKKVFPSLLTIVLLVALTPACSLVKTYSTSISYSLTPENSFRVTYRNVSFVTPPFYSNRIIAEELDLVEQSAPDVWPPFYTQIQFREAWDVGATDNLPSLIQVYPVDELTQTFTAGAAAVSDLRSLLRADHAGSLPAVLPFWPLEFYTQVAGAPPASWGDPVLTARTGYLNFQSGDGVRYVTFLESQPPRVQRMDSLIYTYQGLTADGKYYISVILPILINDQSASADLEALAEQDPPDYASIQQRLDLIADDGFSLSLVDCDNLVASIAVTP
jgi:hypothetical protein